MSEERIYKGIPASQGISIGRVYLYTRKQIKINLSLLGSDEVQNEIDEFRNAIEISRKELRKIFDLAVERIGVKNSKIFEAQLEILNDNYFFNDVINRIRNEKRSASFIFNDEIKKLETRFIEINDDYLKERLADLNDVKNRVVRNMKREKLVSKVEENSIIVAHELSPADTILFSRRKVQGYLTDTGGVTSHAAIISRALRVPAVVGLKVIAQNAIPGERIIVDGTEGLVILDPKSATLEKYEDKIRLYREQEKKLYGVMNLPGVTLDGKMLDISVNIDLDEELDFVEQSKACGIGLYRTEHLFIDKGDFPTEAEQIEEYSRISTAAYPNKVTIRTYDIGGDKLLPSSEREDNPFLGWRGIRLCLDRENIFREQLRALLISSVKKNLRIMIPMISSIDEVRRTRKIIDELKEEISKEGYTFDEKVQVGIMVEVPSAALLADELAKEADFFSIGSNDLIQYLIAVDRGNELVAAMYKEFHPAVIRCLKVIIDAAHRNNIKVSICGEMASIPLAALMLLGLGIDELSVLPGMFAEIKQIIRSTKYSEIRNIVQDCLAYPTEPEIRKVIEDYFNENVKQYVIPENNNVL